MDRDTDHTTDLVSDLRSALQNDEIVPFFQPLIHFPTGQIGGFEALARWTHPTRGSVPPSEFIPLAEAHGLISDLTDRMLHAACTAARDWPTEITLAVNISALQLHDRSLPSRFRAIAEQTGFSMHRLVLEITESAMIENVDSASEVVAELKSAGAQLSLDDFGTGFSSLLQLQALPFDEIKIDASFVRSMTHRRESRKIVAAVIGMGISLGQTTVAEGVETQQQAEMLQALGCDFGQGWWLGRPVPAAEALRGLIDGRWVQKGVDRTAQLASQMAARLEASPSRRLAELRALYDGAPVGLAMLDRDLCYVSLNRRLAEIHGMSVAAHVGRTIKDVDIDLYNQVEAHLRRALLGHPAPNVRIRYALPGMPYDPRFYTASYYPVHDEMDRVIGISLSVVEVVDRNPDSRAANLRSEPEPLPPADEAWEVQKFCPTI